MTNKEFFKITSKLGFKPKEIKYYDNCFKIMKTWTEKLEGIIAFIESGNGFAKAKAKKELEEMAKEADDYKIWKKDVKSIFEWD